MIDDLMSRTRHFLDRMVLDYVKRSLDDLLRRILGRTLRYSIAAALLIMAAAFLLLGGFEGLLVSGLPRYAAHLVIGGVSLLAGFVILKCCTQPS